MDRHEAVKALLSKHAWHCGDDNMSTRCLVQHALQGYDAQDQQMGFVPYMQDRPAMGPGHVDAAEVAGQGHVLAKYSTGASSSVAPMLQDCSEFRSAFWRSVSMLACLY